ncbi:YwhD family protein [Brevibacillus daliensis]|uniref:YwhD family protein n=1 Tax=Brevibacillus daliensis TaxID=2892995 RepID=UPI001E3CC338|nr:YwhD family protein [Brevibacillus daliensis]
MSLFDNNKKNTGFTIISNKNNDVHGGYGQGMLDLAHVSSIIIDEDDAYIDVGAMHAKSVVEKGIRFSTDKSTVPNGKPYWIIWASIDSNENGPYYAGMTACYMEIDREARRGYKLLVDHVNRMDASMKRKILLSELGEQQKKALRTLLMEHNPALWENSSAELKEALHV